MTSNWQYLDDVCERIVDCPHSTPKWTDHGFIVLRNQNIRNGRLDLSSPSYTDAKHYKHRINRAKPVAGDIIFTREAPMGEVCIIPDGLQCCVGQRQVLLRPAKTINSKYLFYAMQSSYVRNQVLWNEGTGSVVSNVRIPVVKKLKIPRFDAEHEQYLANTLSSLDDKIELNQRMNETLEAIAHTLFKSWFVDFDPVKAKAEGRKPEGMDDTTAALFPSGFTESNLGPVPEGWVLGKLGDVADNPRTGVQPTEISSDIPYIGLEHMPRHSISLYEWEGAGKVTSTKSAMQKGDFLFGKLRPYFHKVGISPINGITSTDILIVCPKSDSFYSYLLMLISSVPFVEYTDKSSQGTKMPRTTWRDMSRYESIFPNEEVFIAYDTLVRPMFYRIIANIHENKALIDIRDTLLPKLISGKLRVGEISETVEALAL